MNYPRSCRHSYPQPSNTKPKKVSSNSDAGTYEIEICEGISLENNSAQDKNLKTKKNDCPYFESYYPNFFPESTTDTSVNKTRNSKSQVYDTPEIAAYYCDPYEKKPNCQNKPNKKCNHVRVSNEVKCQPPQQPRICPPRCMPQKTPPKDLCKKREQSKSRVDSEERRKNNLPPCDCKECKDERCDGYKSSRTYTVSSKESVREKSKSREGRRGECAENRNKEKEPYFQHFIEKLCEEGEKEKASTSRGKEACKHEDCPCFSTKDRLKEVNERIEALEAIYRLQIDATDEPRTTKSSKSIKSKETLRYDDGVEEEEETVSKSSRRESRRESVRRSEEKVKKESKEKDQPQKIKKEPTKETITFEDDPKRVKTEPIHAESNYDTTEEDENTPHKSIDSDFAKTTEEIENELLEIRQRLEKLEALHAEREKVKASSVSAEVIPAKVAEKEVPVYSTIIYNPEAQWHQVTEISENESQTDDDTINTKKSTAATSEYEKFMLSGKSEESEKLEKSEQKNKNPENLNGNKYENYKSELHGCPCGCGTCVNNKRKGTNDNGKKKTVVEEETILEEECESNQKIKENFMIVCKILRNKLSFLLRSDKRKRKSKKGKLEVSSSATNLSSENTSPSSTKILFSPENTSMFTTSQSVTTSSGTKILYHRSFLDNTPSYLTYTKGDTTQSSETDPLPPFYVYNSDETPQISDSDKTYLCEGSERVHLQYNARIDENRNMNEVIYYLQSGDSSSNSRLSIKNFKDYYFPPKFFDFESEKNCVYPKYEKTSRKSPFYEEFDNCKRIVYTAHDQSSQNQECECSGLGSTSNFGSKKNEDRAVVVRTSKNFEDKNEKSEANPFEFLSSEGQVKIPVLFEELCKKSTPQHPDPKISMKVVLVALEEERKEKDAKKLVRNYSPTESSDERKKFAFGVSKCDCEKSVVETERSSLMQPQTSRSSEQLFMASRESLKSTELIPMENEISETPKTQTNQKSIKCRCCHCNGEYVCPNVLNHVDPPNLVGLKRTLKDLGFSNLSEKLDDKIDFTKLIRKTQAVYSAPFNKIRRKREVSLSKSDEKIKSYISGLAESIKGSKNFSQLKTFSIGPESVTIGPESVSQLPYDEESKYAELLKMKEVERSRMRYESSDVPIKVQSEVPEVRKVKITPSYETVAPSHGNATSHHETVVPSSGAVTPSQNSKLPVISINIKTTIYGDPPTVKEFDVTTEEMPRKYDAELKRKISSERSIQASSEESSSHKKSLGSESTTEPSISVIKSLIARKKSFSIESDDPRLQGNSTRTLLSEPLSESSKSLEITIEESKGSLQTLKHEASASYRRIITSKDSIEVMKKRRSLRGSNGKRTSVVVTPEEEVIMRRLQELESRLTAIERNEITKPDENEIPRKIQSNSTGQSSRSVKFSKNNHAKTVFLALFKPFRNPHKAEGEVGSKASKTKVLFKSSMDKFYGLKARFSKSKNVDKEKEEEIPDDIVDGLIDDCSRSSPPLSKRKVPLVMESVEPIRAGKKSKKKKKKAEKKKQKEDKVEKKVSKFKRKKKAKFL